MRKVRRGRRACQCGDELRARSSAQTLLADPELSGTPRSPGKVRPSPLLASHTRIPLRRSAEPGWQVWAAGEQSGAPPQAQAAWDLQPDPGTPLGVCVSASRCHQSNEATRPCSCQQTRRVPARTNALTAENATPPRSPGPSGQPQRSTHRGRPFPIDRGGGHPAAVPACGENDDSSTAARLGAFASRSGLNPDLGGRPRACRVAEGWMPARRGAQAGRGSASSGTAEGRRVKTGGRWRHTPAHACAHARTHPCTCQHTPAHTRTCPHMCTPRHTHMCQHACVCTGMCMNAANTCVCLCVHVHA